MSQASIIKSICWNAKQKIDMIMCVFAQLWNYMSGRAAADTGWLRKKSWKAIVGDYLPRRALGGYMQFMLNLVFYTFCVFYFQTVIWLPVTQNVKKNWPAQQTILIYLMVVMLKLVLVILVVMVMMATLSMCLLPTCVSSSPLLLPQ